MIRKRILEEAGGVGLGPDPGIGSRGPEALEMGAGAEGWRKARPGEGAGGAGLVWHQSAHLRPLGRATSGVRKPQSVFLTPAFSSPPPQKGDLESISPLTLQLRVRWG